MRIDVERQVVVYQDEIKFVVQITLTYYQARYFANEHSWYY